MDGQRNDYFLLHAFLTGQVINPFWKNGERKLEIKKQIALSPTPLLLVKVCTPIWKEK